MSSSNYPVITRNVIIVLVFLYLSTSIYGDNQSPYKHRVKRKVVFSRSSKFFFRLNGKDNVVNQTEIFAHGWAIRVNYDLPDTLPKRHKFFKRDIHNEIENIPNQPAMEGFSCILKYVCEIVAELSLSNECGIFCEVGKIIARSEGIEADFFRTFLDKCDFHVDTCPYSFKDSSIYNYG